MIKCPAKGRYWGVLWLVRLDLEPMSCIVIELQEVPAHPSHLPSSSREVMREVGGMAVVGLEM